ncbi:MAG: MogA/MoaB family molybdenum cofactor biosynthesis protein, partial [Clostridia bacterium]|nr:MogA/MoaB family molybdenum cofactor biosynthesis protein [Clostridia bacterium]
MGYTAAVLTISDKGARGERVDTSGPALREMLAQAGYEVVGGAILPDERDQIAGALREYARKGIALVLTTGGTGFSPRDITPEATLDVIERETPGLAELMRAESMKITPRGCLSRGVAGILDRTLIVNLPGSEKAARENLAAVLPALDHGLKMLMS